MNGLMRFDAALEREAVEALGDLLAEQFDSDTPPDRVALVVVSDNAGSATSLRFWSEAQRTGVALASPELFPWCLANAPCGALARRFGVTGPNVTLLGEAEALAAGCDHASDLLAAGNADAVVLLAISFAEPPGAGVARAWRLASREAASALRGAPASRTQTLRSAIDS